MDYQICTDKVRWDAFAAASPHGNVFCTTSFLDALPVDYELVTMTDKGVIVLGAIVLLRASDVVKAPYPLTVYEGVLCAGDIQQMLCHKRSKLLLESLTALLNEMGSRYHRISFCLYHTFEDLRPFQWFHYHEPHEGMFRIDLRYTGLLDLTQINDFETYLSHVRTDRRQAYRKALAEGLTIESSDDIDLLNKLHGMTFERQGLARSNDEESLLLSISSAALKNGFGELLVCRDRNGTPASATLFLYDNRYGYYWVGANDPEYRKSGAGTLLVMENIRRCLDKGLAGVDFVGINSPDRGDFKTSFNAKPTAYFMVDFVKPAN